MDFVLLALQFSEENRIALGLKLLLTLPPVWLFENKIIKEKADDSLGHIYKSKMYFFMKLWFLSFFDPDQTTRKDLQFLRTDRDLDRSVFRKLGLD